MGVAARLKFDAEGRIEAAAIATGPAGPVPFRAVQTEAFLIGRMLDEATLDEAAQVLLGEVHVRTSPHRATAAHGAQCSPCCCAARSRNAPRVPNARWRSTSVNSAEEERGVMARLTLTINGEVRSAEVAPGAFLAEVLRETFGLTGTKIGCNEAECGICTVLVDGVPVNSCIYPALKANGAHVQTVEGLAQNGQLHPLQQAFIEHGAVQCGFCTPGLLMTAKALLDQNPNPSEDDIKHALKDTYCRCTGYVSVISAIRDAAARLRGEPPIPPALPHTREPLRFVGRPLPRPDAVAKVTGAAKYRRLRLPQHAPRRDAARWHSSRPHQAH